MRVCLCDDHRLFVEALTTLLEANGHDVVATLSRPGDALEAVTVRRVDVCVMDLHFADLDEDPLTQIAKVARVTKVVVLTGSEDDLDAPLARAGVRAWARKAQRGDDVVRLLEQVQRGRPMGTAGGEASGEILGGHDLARFLTPREVEVLHGLTTGASTAQLTKVLGVRPATVRAHLQSLFVKLGVHSRIEAVAFALEHDLVDLRHAARLFDPTGATTEVAATARRTNRR